MWVRRHSLRVFPPGGATLAIGRRRRRGRRKDESVCVSVWLPLFLLTYNCARALSLSLDLPSLVHSVCFTRETVRLRQSDFHKNGSLINFTSFCILYSCPLWRILRVQPIHRSVKQFVCSFITETRGLEKEGTKPFAPPFSLSSLSVARWT